LRKQAITLLASGCVVSWNCLANVIQWRHGFCARRTRGRAY